MNKYIRDSQEKNILSKSIASSVSISPSSVAAGIVEDLCQHIEIPVNVSPVQHVPTSVVVIHVGGHDSSEPHSDGHCTLKVMVVPEHQLVVSVARMNFQLVISSMIKGNSTNVIFTPNVWFRHPLSFS